MKNNVQVGARLKNREEDIKNIIELYLSGKSLTFIGKIYQYNHHTISAILKKNNVQVRDRCKSHRKYTINQDFFEKIDSHEKSQILGMIAADGCVLDRNGFQISLCVDDKEYVEWIKDKVEYQGNIRICKNHGYKNGKDLASLKFHNFKLVGDLEKLGICKRKSLILEFPTRERVPDEFLNSYILGYFEGDGGIHIDKSGCFHINIASSLNFCNKLKGILKDILNVHTTISAGKNNKIYYISFGGNKQCLKFFEWIYKDSSFRMLRKYEKYLQLKKGYGNILKYHDNKGFGENNGANKLTIFQVLEIKEMLKNKMKHREIASKFNVCKGLISQIHRGKAWKYSDNEQYLKEIYGIELKENNI